MPFIFLPDTKNDKAGYRIRYDITGVINVSTEANRPLYYSWLISSVGFAAERRGSQFNLVVWLVMFEILANRLSEPACQPGQDRREELDSAR